MQQVEGKVIGRSKLIKMLNKMATDPQFRAREYEEIDGSKKGAIFVSAEDCWKDDMPVAMYWEGYEHPDFKKLLDGIANWHWEWTNPGCLGIWRDF